MNLDRLNDWLSLIANIGVLLGILLVAYELRQNSIVVEAQTRSQLADETVDSLWRQMEMEDLRLALQKQSRGEEISPDERWLLGRHAHVTLRRWENIYYQYRIGLYDEEEFAAQSANWERVAYSSMIEPYWEVLRPGYSPEFVRLIDGFGRGQVTTEKEGR